MMFHMLNMWIWLLYYIMQMVCLIYAIILKIECILIQMVMNYGVMN